MAVLGLGRNQAQMIGDRIMSPNQFLAKTTLTKDIGLGKSSDIYARFADTISEPGMISTTGFELSYVHVNVAWESNPVGDIGSPWTFLGKGTSVMDAIRQIARSRHEVIADRQNYVVIRRSFDVPLLKSYQIKNGKEDSELTKWVNTIIPPGRTDLLRLNGNLVEEFLNIKLKESLSLAYGANAPSFTFAMDDKAKLAVAKVSVVGCWVYSELLDAYCALAGLHWEIEGKTLWLKAD